MVGDPKRVLAGTDCGFDTSAGMRRVAEDVVWAKLAALGEGRGLRRSGCSDAGRDGFAATSYAQRRLA